VTISLVDETLREVLRWNLDRAWPLEVRDSLRSDGVPLEEMVLAYERVTLVNPPPQP
jgi:hypothetical protein